MKLVFTTLLILLVAACPKPKHREASPVDPQEQKKPSEAGAEPEESSDGEGGETPPGGAGSEPIKSKRNKDLTAEELIKAVEAKDIPKAKELVEKLCGKDPNCLAFNGAFKDLKGETAVKLRKRAAWATNPANFPSLLESRAGRISDAVVEEIEHPEKKVPETPQEIASEVLNLAKQQAGPTWDYVQKNVQPHVQPVIDLVTGKATEAAGAVKREINTAIEDAAAAIPKGIWKGIKAVGSEIGTTVVGAVQGAGAWLSSLISNLPSLQFPDPSFEDTAQVVSGMPLLPPQNEIQEPQIDYKPILAEILEAIKHHYPEHALELVGELCAGDSQCPHFFTLGKDTELLERVETVGNDWSHMGYTWEEVINEVVKDMATKPEEDQEIETHLQ